MISFTEAQVLALITDPGTLKRGQELLKPAKWTNLGRTDTAAWGECAGSGSKPYLTGIDLTEPAFKCSCPSRVFPCKHGAGLLLLMARQPELFTGNIPPAWLDEWLGKRQQTQGKKVEKEDSSIAALVTKAPKASSAAELLHGEDAPAGSPSPRDSAPEATAGPASEGSREVNAKGGIGVDPKRLARMVAGAGDLAAWLEDLMRAGLATLDKQPAKFWESQAARLIDNQLPGLAATVRELATLRHAHADWPSRLLARLGELHLLVRAFQNLLNLSPTARQEVLQQVGINLKKDELLATAPPVADAWQVLGQFRWDEDRLTARRTWLRGRDTGRTALMLEFSFGGQPFATPLIPRGSYLGEVVFYPGLLSLRAAPVSLKFDGTVPPEVVPQGQCISQLLHDYANALARQPWLREWPATLAQVRLTPLPDGSWLLYHATETGTLPLRFAEENAPFELLAQSGGQPLTLFGEWDGRAFRPLSSWVANAEAPETTVLQTQFRVVTQESSGLPSPGDSATKADAGPAPEGSREANWPQLLRTALLGTRQSGEIPPNFPNLPTPDSAEQQLLQAAGTLALMHKAGYLPAALTVPPLAAAPPELLPVVGPKGTSHLHQMLVNSLHLDLLPDYLTRLAGRDLRVPPALLVPLLHHATRSTETQAALGPVLGERGHWLAALHPEWTKLTDSPAAVASNAADLTTWETGTPAARLAWLTQHFAQMTDAARALLLAALPAEPAKTQKALLEILARHLHPDAEPTLEALLKARGQDVRRRAAEMLVQIPGAALTERLWNRAAPLITAKRKLLGLGKTALEITLPTAWDKSWLLDGIEEKNERFLMAHVAGFRAAVGPATARLANLLALLPPRRWTAQLALTPPELLAAALASEWALPLLSAWSQSALLHHDADFAAAFLHLWLHERPALDQAHIGRNIDWPGLAALLSAAAQQQLLLPDVIERVRQQTTAWTSDLDLVRAPWPHALSHAVLEAVAGQLTKADASDPNSAPYYQLQHLARFLVQTLAPSIAPADTGWAIQQAEALAEVPGMFQSQFRFFADDLRFQADLEASLNG